MWYHIKHFLLKSLNLELAGLSRTPAWHESPLHPSNSRKKWALLRLQTFTSSDQRLSTGQHPQFLHNYNSAILHILLCPFFTLPPARSPFPSFALLLTTLSPIINRWGNYQQRCCVKNQPKSIHSISWVHWTAYKYSDIMWNSWVVASGYGFESIITKPWPGIIKCCREARINIPLLPCSR